jgi:hypothetical protein
MYSAAVNVNVSWLPVLLAATPVGVTVHVPDPSAAATGVAVPKNIVSSTRTPKIEIIVRFMVFLLKVFIVKGITISPVICFKLLVTFFFLVKVLNVLPAEPPRTLGSNTVCFQFSHLAPLPHGINVQTEELGGFPGS